MTDRSTLDGFFLPPPIKVSNFTKLKFGAVQIRLPALTATTLSDVINHLLAAQEPYLSKQSERPFWKSSMPPWHGGGEMIKYVTFEKTIYNDLPYKFEAGTPHIAGGIGLGAAIDYVTQIGLEAIGAHEHDLLAYATQRAAEISGLRIIGTARAKSGILSFDLGRIHPHDIGTMLDHQGIAIRTGHHCAMPVMQHYCVPATARASFALYNTRADVDALMVGIRKVIEVFR